MAPSAGSAQAKRALTTPCREDSLDREPKAAGELERVRARILAEDTAVVDLCDGADGLPQWDGDPAADLHHWIRRRKIGAREPHTADFARLELVGSAHEKVNERHRLRCRASFPANTAGVCRKRRRSCDGGLFEL